MSQLILKNVRLSFPSVFKRSVFNGVEGKFEATFLIPKSDEATISQINKAIDELIKESKINKASIGEDKICLRDGDKIFNKEGEPLDGYTDHYSFKASSNNKIQVVDRNKMPITEEDNIIYAGCYVNAIIGIWYQNNNYGRRINGNLYAIQFIKDGESFGSSPVNVTNMFDTLDSELDFDDDLDL